MGGYEHNCQALVDSGHFKNTTAGFTSDDGCGWREHCIKRKIASYDAQMRIPMVGR